MDAPLNRAAVTRMRPLERKALFEEVAEMVRIGELGLGDAVRFLRSAVLGMDRSTFARAVKLSLPALRQLEEKPDANPTVDTLNKVFAPFGAKMGLVFPRMDPPAPLDDERRARRDAIQAALLKARRRRRTPPVGR
jgi:hypothetical protein